MECQIHFTLSYRLLSIVKFDDSSHRCVQETCAFLLLNKCRNNDKAAECLKSKSIDERLKMIVFKIHYSNSFFKYCKSGPSRVVSKP